MNTILITQARTGSTRLPGKVLKEIQGEPLLKIHLMRLEKCTSVDQVVVATTSNSSDDLLFNKVVDWRYKVFRGDENDVLDRFYQVAKLFEPKWIVRVTSDCPLIDPNLVDEVVSFVQKKDVDYGANIIVEKFPDGQDIEVFKFSALERAWREATVLSDREHVTPFIRNNSDAKGGNLFSAVNYPAEKDLSFIRMTVDELKDFYLMERLIVDLGTDKSWNEYVDYIIDNNLTELNKNIIRNEGYLRSVQKDK